MATAAQPRSTQAPAFRRVLLKLSGEALMGSAEFGLDAATVNTLARELVDVQALGVELALVLGGGNIYRGMKATAAGMDRATADYMGMLATVFNSLAVQEALERNGADTRVLSALDVREVAEPYIRRRAIRHLEKGRVVIFAAGTGNPYFTTDTAERPRARNGCGGDPHGEERRPRRVRRRPAEGSQGRVLPELTHLQAIERGLRVMDTTASRSAWTNHLPIYVFELVPGNVARVIGGERVGTIISTPSEGGAR